MKKSAICKILSFISVLSVFASCSENRLSNVQVRLLDSLQVEYKNDSWGYEEKVLVNDKKVFLLFGAHGDLLSVQTIKSRNEVYVNDFYLNGNLESQGWMIEDVFVGHTYFYNSKGQLDEYSFRAMDGSQVSQIKFEENGELIKHGTLNLKREFDFEDYNIGDGLRLNIENVNLKNYKIISEISERRLADSALVLKKFGKEYRSTFFMKDPFNNFIELNVLLLNKQKPESSIDERWVFYPDTAMLAGHPRPPLVPSLP